MKLELSKLLGKPLDVPVYTPTDVYAFVLKGGRALLTEEWFDTGVWTVDGNDEVEQLRPTDEEFDVAGRKELYQVVLPFEV